MSDPAQTKPDWKTRILEFGSALKNVPKAFVLLWEADKSSTLWMSAVTLAGALLPVSQAWVTKLIVDGVLAGVHDQLSPVEGLRSVGPYLIIEFVLIFLGMATSQIRALVQELIDHKLGHIINIRIIRKALSLEPRYFEDAEFYDKMQNARRQSEYRAMAVVDSSFLLIQNIVTLISFLVVLLSFNAWVGIILFGAAIPAFVNQTRYSRLTFRLQTWRAPETRQMSYFEQLLTQDSAVKEIRIFGLGEPLLKRYAKLFWKTFNEDAALAKARSWKSLGWGILATLSYYGAYAWIVLKAIARDITLGDMTLYVSLFRQSQGAFQGALSNVNRLYESGLFLDNLFGFFDLESQVPVLDQATRPKEDPSRGIELKNVWFQYPKHDNWVLQDLSLTVHPGEKLALVGENGAGKTTLIKLLTRLAEPTKGTILFNGVDLRYFPPDELNRRMGAIFQDFIRYQFSFKDNIGVGHVEQMGNEDLVRSSAKKGGADEVAATLPHGYETQLGQWFEDGQDLSGGQWQKIALSRSFMRDAEVLILDEPTSSLDAEAEYEVFRKFRELTQDKTVILVSHRFSTVRMADKIVVLKNGKIEEQGSHADLVARGGVYARLFQMQAEGYR